MLGFDVNATCESERGSGASERAWKLLDRHDSNTVRDALKRFRS